ncbi:MAG: hypothetical protein GX923_02300 [Clostridia bacterium]|nr:hypothetical protein [Clostridia bacterium]
MTNAVNCCSLCGQVLNLVDEPFAEYQELRNKNNKPLCLQCYQEECDRWQQNY